MDSRFLRPVRLTAVVIALGALTFLMSCGGDEDSTFIDALIRLSPSRYEDERPSEEKIAEWQRDIRRFESLLNEKVDAADGAANLHKLLAEEYARLEMWGLALEEYEHVLEYEPANAVVLYSAGVAASQFALSRPRLEAETEYLLRSRRYHERAIDINPGYPDPYMALGVLFFYELGEVEEAKRILSRGVELFPNESIRMLFVLAQIAITEDRIEDAVDLYDRIARETRNPDERTAAISNREEILTGP
jgi:tetratricopeptide (TPR) repeat protein